MSDFDTQMALENRALRAELGRRDREHASLLELSRGALNAALSQVAVLRGALEKCPAPRAVFMPACCDLWSSGHRSGCPGKLRADALTQTEQAASDYVNRLRQSWALSSEAEAQQREATAREEALEELFEVRLGSKCLSGCCNPPEEWWIRLKDEILTERMGPFANEAEARNAIRALARKAGEG